MKFPNSQVFINKLNNLFNGLIAVPLLLVAFGYLEIRYGTWTALIAPSNAIVIGMSIGLTVMIIYLSLKFKKESRNLTVYDDIQDKLSGYYSLASFYYWSVFAISLITTSLLFLFAHVAFVIVYAILLFWMSIFRPTLRSLADLLGLKDDEKRKFLNKEPF